jgi:hypothetical protein
VKEEKKDILILHVLKALISCISGNGEVTCENGSISIVGKDEDFHIVEGEDLKVYLDRLREFDNDTNDICKIVEDVDGKEKNSNDERNNKRSDENENDEIKYMET